MPEPIDFRPAGALGTRFDIQRPIGRGGCGLVYLANDTLRGTPCALKTLRREKRGGRDSAASAALKSEFRTLANIRHPNLVTLFELFEPNGRDATPFFTMEYVQGASFQNAFWWPGGGSEERGVQHTGTRSHTGGPISLVREPGSRIGDDTADFPAAAPRTGEVMDWEALRDGMVQLLEGLAHLHAHRRAHCDIKPGNVLITHTGRVVILDFGISQALDALQGFQSHSERASADSVSIRGTLPYLAPEQARPGKPTSACDLYAAGVMLYEAAAGRRPFPNSQEEMLRLKATQAAPDPRDIAPDVPDWVSSFCASVLLPEAARRASATDAIDMLQSAAKKKTPRRARAMPQTFAGRDEELAAMHAAVREADATRGSVLLVSGPSGIGKSALLDHFIQSLEEDPAAAASAKTLVIRGRCYERETLPFNAFDEFITQLSRVPNLPTLPDAELRAVRRAFPALRAGLPDVSSPTSSAGVRDDAHKQKRRAFSGLTRLLGNLAETLRLPAALVLVVDDIQWSDEDSEGLLRALIQASKTSRWTLLLGLRTPESEPDATHEALPSGETDWLRRIPLGPLSTAEATTLAARGTLSRAAAEQIALASGGHPYLIELLLGEPSERQGHAQPAASPTVLLRAALSRRINELPDSARSLLELVSVAQRPVPDRVLDHILSTEESLALRSSLVAGQFIRTSYHEAQELVAPYHDRLREVVAAAMTPVEILDAHRRLAAAFAALGGAATDLGFHYRESGDPRAFEHLCRAARDAASELAFVRAGDMFQQALKVAPKTEDPTELWRSSGVAYANAGHPGRAAKCFVEAAGATEGSEGIALRNRAAELFLIGGYVEEGLALAKQQARATGTRLAPRWQVFSTLVLNRLLPARSSWASRTSFFASQGPHISARIDLLDLLAKGLLLVDIPGSAYYQHRATRLALISGNQEQQLDGYLGLALHVAGTYGSARVEPAKRLARRAEALANAIGTRTARGRAMGMWMMLANDEARWQDAVVHGRKALEILSPCLDITWYRNSCRLMVVRSLNFVGGFHEMRRDLSHWIRDAQQRGDRHAETYLRLGAEQHALLASDEPARAKEVLLRTRIISAPGSFTLEHWLRWNAEIQTALYERDGARAWRVSESTWRPLKRSMLLSHRRIRAISSNTRARAALAGALCASGKERERRLKIAQRSAKSLRDQNEKYTSGWAEVRLAEVALIRGEEQIAQRRLIRALRLLPSVHMRLDWLYAFRLLAQLDGDVARVQKCDDTLAAMGITDPARFALIQTPSA